MKKLKGLFCILVLFSASLAVAKDKPIKSSYDKMQDITTISGWMVEAKQAKDSDGKKWSDYGLLSIQTGAMYACHGNVQGCTPQGVLLVFQAFTRQWLFVGNPQVFFLVDGKRSGPISSTSTQTNPQLSDCSGDGCILTESVTVVALPDHFKELTNAKSVEVQINDFDIVLTDKNLASLKQVADTMRNGDGK